MSDSSNEFSTLASSFGFSNAGLARVVKSLAPSADELVMARRFRRWSKGKSEAPDEAIALLTLLTRVRGLLPDFEKKRNLPRGKAFKRGGKPPEGPGTPISSECEEPVE